MGGHGLIATSIIAGAILPASSVIPALSSTYLFSLADCVDYNTSLPGNGIVLDINHFLIYSCRPRYEKLYMLYMSDSTIAAIILLIGLLLSYFIRKKWGKKIDNNKYAKIIKPFIIIIIILLYIYILSLLFPPIKRF